MLRTLFLTTLCLAFSAASFADKVVLKDGRTYEGVVLDENDASVKIKTAKATLTFQRDQVASVERAAGGALQEREKRLAALDPAKPADYLAVAEWMTGKGKEAYDLPTLRRLCAIASKLDANLSFDAQMLLGKSSEALGMRREAAMCYARAKLSKPANPEVRVRLDDLRQGLFDDARKEMEQLAAALDLVIQDRFEEALPKLQKAGALAKSEDAQRLMGMSVEELTRDIAKRVKCRTCEGAGEASCPACGGKALQTCSVCDGTGAKKGFSAGKEESGISNSVCRTCFGIGDLLCVKCKAERDIEIDYGYSVKRKVHATAGHEADALRAEVDLIKYVLKGSTRCVVSIHGLPPCPGGKTPCGTCQGIKYEPPRTPPPKDKIQLFMVEVVDCVKGQKAYDVVPAASTMYDPAAIADGCMLYRNGKWLK
ncbi:MAG: hypothetical protein FD180_2961 [Planctomycetota bacterium]|nr:MAG: hypothetical protein FD180_2961 [Planctomycetota bacterium]